MDSCSLLPEAIESASTLSDRRVNLHVISRLTMNPFSLYCYPDLWMSRYATHVKSVPSGHAAVGNRRHECGALLPIPNFVFKHIIGSIHIPGWPWSRCSNRQTLLTKHEAGDSTL
ncbi:hypothetical protein DSO57_1026406 [Entomophthora muscae]|uniref:Uncharacterized protein n=1 Tax=Entomophthora muscae TaxID=34485 RepID=A0ACC2UCW7_9FUNG|nr:hypothetical protein DSO57_1026406 [Entomophthora muscae]